MLIGSRIRDLRLAMNLSQGDIERRTGLFRCYVSRVENDFIVPTVETLEKFAHALEIPLYQLFYEGKRPRSLRKAKRSERPLWGRAGKDRRYFERMRAHLARMSEKDRRLLFTVANKMVRR